MSELIGQTISKRYRVDAFLGKGGMAEVYKIWDRSRSVHLAMKILHDDLAEDKIFLRRFRREAQTLAKLQHPHIVRFYGLGQDDDLVFMLMDYVEGTTLRKEIFKSDKPFSQESVVRIIRPVCAALHYAHQSGFIHCDVKPANIMIHQNGTILVADFGIARMTEAATMTMAGAGTPAYMAPEQARGENPVLETDIYALGVMLFELLTGGERPFTGEHARTTGTTSEKVRWEQLNVQPPSPQKFNPKISPDLSALVLKCLNKDPKDRYHSTLDLLEAFESSITIKTIRIASSEDKVPEEAAPPATLFVEQDTEKHEGFLERFLPKLNSLPAMFLKLWTSFKFSGSRSATAPENDKRKIAFPTFWRRKWIWGVLGVIMIGSLLYFSSSLGPTPKQDRTDRKLASPPAVSSTGTLYFTSNREKKTEIYKLTAGKVIRVTHTSGSAVSWGPIMSNTGTLYFVSSRDGKPEIYKLIGGKAIRVTRTPSLAASWSPVISNAGTLYFTSDRDGKPEIYKLIDGKVMRVTRTPSLAASWAPVISSAGTPYFTSNRDGKPEIYKLIDGKVMRVTRTPSLAASWAPVISNAGTLYFTSDRDGKPEIYKLIGGKVMRVTRTPSLAASWAPTLSNAGTLYFTSDRDGKPEIYKLIDGKAIRVIYTNGVAGSWVLYPAGTGLDPNWGLTSNPNAFLPFIETTMLCNTNPGQAIAADPLPRRMVLASSNSRTGFLTPITTAVIHRITQGKVIS